MDNKVTIEQFGQQIKLKYPQYSNLSDREIGEKVLAKYPEYQDRIKPDEGFLADIKGIWTGIKESAEKRADKFGEIDTAEKKGEQGAFRSVLQKAGQSLGFASDVIGETVMGGLKALTPQKQQEQVGGLFQKAVAKITDTDMAKNAMTWYSNLDDKSKRDVESAIGAGSLITDIMGAGLAKKPLTTAVKKTVDVAGNVAKGTLNASKNVIETGKNVAGGTLDVIKSTAQRASQIPKNIATNVDEIKRIETEIKTLPKLAQESVRQGVDITDAKELVKIKPQTKPTIKKLWNATKSYLEGKSELNPITAVGKPVVARLNKLKGETKLLNEKLTQVAQGLKGQAVRGKDELVSVANNGLETLGIKAKKTGLDFIGSDLEGVGGNTLIENVYKRLINSKDAYDLHRLKKFIDSNVEFGKRAEGLTGSAERLLKTWRKNIDGLLDNNFKSYNSVNTKLSEKISPLNDLRKYLRTAEDVLDEDLLDLDVGMLMQRIASNVRSNPALRQTLRNLDKASGVKGTLSGEIDTLVNFYSTLQDYFPEIVNKNSFRGQITRGIQDAKGISEAVVGAVKDLAGQTDVVRKKALKDLLDKLLN